MPVKVKICGITNLEDARVALNAGADALGFMFFAGSPRHIACAAAADIMRRLDKPVMRVGVFVNPSADEVRRAVEVAGVDTLQFHGEETPEFIAGLNYRRPAAADPPLATWRDDRPPVAADPPMATRPGARTIKAFRIRDVASLAELPRFATDFWLLDSFVSGVRGGTGARFNWELALAAKKLGRPIILAGGLTPENVAAAVRTVQPFAVDVSSGVEASPGRKDHAQLRAFIAAAKGAA
jgi:phosphoribosylanthranilate isomerase